MAEIAVRADGLGKHYQLSGGSAQYGRLSEILSGALLGRFRKNRAASTIDDFWALRDVSFEIPAGSAVGIIGRNGAGKSTLLKILSRITSPTVGSATLRGRIASLLEVGTGFHAELSGTENIYLSGAVLGMRRAEIQRKYDEIVQFSGIDTRFLATPVKRYSSGMQVRLGFAVAAHLESEILLVDEVLAVGDMEFQRRCLGKMDEVTGSGRTILFVSHQLPMVASLCDRCLLFEGGQLIAEGPTSDIINRYQRGVGNSAGHVTYMAATRRPGDGHVSLLEAWVGASSGEVLFESSLMDPIHVFVRYRVHHEMKATPQPVLHVHDSSGAYVFVTHPHDWATDSALAAGDYLATLEVPGHFLNDDMYSISVGVNHFERGLETAFLEPSVISFTIVDRFGQSTLREASRWGGRYPGAVRPLLAWTLERTTGQLIP